jgi:hypothetical protein
MTKEPRPPFVELNFYIADRPEQESFVQLLTTLVGLGATFTGEAYAHRAEGIRDIPFADVHELPLERVSVHDDLALTNYVADPDIRLVQVYMHNATGSQPDIAEIVTYQSISEAATRHDRHPFSIWTSGDWTEWENYTGALRKQVAQRAQQAGRQIYHQFLSLLAALRPAYAAITVEGALECPTDLRQDPRSLAFQDFFMSGSYLGADNLQRIQKLFPSAYHEVVGDGIYISCYKGFNPEGKQIDADDAGWLSVEVAKLIAELR